MAQYNLNRNYTLSSITTGDTAECYWYATSNEGTISVSNGNLTLEKTSLTANWDWIRATRGVSSGKWYWEVTVDSAASAYLMVGVTTTDNPSASFVGYTNYGWGYYGFSGEKYHNNVSSSWGATYGALATIRMALDMDNHDLYISDGDGNWQQSQDPVNGTNPFANDILGGNVIYPAVDLYHTNIIVTANFGASSFSHSIPLGYTALHYSTFNPDAGNKTLTYNEIDLLVDGNTTSSGVTLSAYDILHMETDLTDRLKVDGIDLYISSPSSSGTVLDNINFYYKNNSEDVYVDAAKYISNGGYYYAVIPSPSAPSSVKVTISGIEATIYEYAIYNDEYLVGYGDEGQLYRKYIERATIGESGPATTLEIFNNNPDTNDPPVDSYTCIDFSGQDGDYYLKLSSSENGTYLGLDDGGVIEDDAITSSMRWSYGEFSNTEIDGSSVVLSDTAFSSYINDVPLVNASTNGWNCMSNCWVWDREEDRIFCMGSDSGPQLKLWEYFRDSNIFEFICVVNPTGPTDHSLLSSMTYINGKAYVCMNMYGKFGYHDVGGALNNWTDLADIPSILTSVDRDRVAIVGDSERYVYAMCSDQNEATPGDGQNSFHRYDTISGTTWEDLDNHFKSCSSDTGWGTQPTLAYDRDRNQIYHITTDSSQPASTVHDYIQCYDIDTDSWNITYYRIADYFTIVQRFKMTIAYKDDYIYLYMVGVSNVLYAVNLNTWLVENVGSIQQGNATNNKYILAAGAAGNKSGTVIFVANPESYAKRIYSYGLYSNNGTYKSPVFRVNDQYMSSYFVIDYTCSDEQNISWDNDYRNGTMYLRSADEDPLDIDEYYWPYRSGTTLTVQKNVIYTDDSSSFASLAVGNGWRWASIAVSPVDGTVAVSMNYSYSSTIQSQLLLYDRDGTQTYTSLDNEDLTRDFDKMQFDSDGGVWAHSAYDNGMLYHFTDHLDETYYTTAGSLLYRDMTVSLGSTNCWYITSTSLYLINDGGGVEARFIFSTPQLLCSDEDGGCWAVSSNTTVYRYNSDGLVKTVSVDRPISYITRDYSNGFWYSDGFMVAHVDQYGEETFSVNISAISSITGGHNSCLVYSVSNETISYVDKSLQAVTNEYEAGDTWLDFEVLPAFFSYDIDDYYTNANVVVPTSYDPVWALAGGSAEWAEVQLNGEWLPKVRYHQVYIKMSSNESDSTPSLDGIIMAPAVKLDNISSQGYKNLYMKTDVPITANVENYETKLRTWWAVTDI